MAKIELEQGKYGEVFLEKSTSTIFQRELIPQLQSELVLTYGPEVQQKLYNVARTNASAVSKLLANAITGVLGMLDAKRLAIELLKQFPKRGYGEAELVAFDSTATRFVVRIYNNFNSKGITNPEHFCAVAAGILAGGAFVVTRREMDAIETKCVARGDAYCEFEVVPSETAGMVHTQA